MNKITQKDIREYKRMEKSNWHDQDWHDFMNTKKSESIAFALNDKNLDAISLTVDAANEYYNFLYSTT